MKLIDWPKDSSVLSKRIVGAHGKQSIYSQISLNCYAVGGSNTGQIHSKIIVFPLGFREAFSLLPSYLSGYIGSNTMELGGFGKDTCVFPMRLNTLMRTPVILRVILSKGGERYHVLQLPQCMDRVIPYNPQSISNEPIWAR